MKVIGKIESVCFTSMKIAIWLLLNIIKLGIGMVKVMLTLFCLIMKLFTGMVRGGII